jgi:hypothetical protein
VRHKLNALDLANSLDIVPRRSCGSNAGQPFRNRRIQRLFDQRRLARPADARHDTQNAQRNLHGNAFQVFALRADEAKMAVDEWAAAADIGLAAKPREPASCRSPRGVRFVELGRHASEHNAPALLSRARTKFNQHVRCTQHGRLVFDDHHRVAAIAQPLNRSDYAFHIRGMQPNRRLIQDIHCAGEAAGQSGSKRHALPLASTQ